MKKIIIALVATVAFSLGVYAQQKMDSLSYNDKGFAIAKIKTSAVCNMCKETIEKAMAYEKGVKDGVLDVDSKILTVTFDTKKTDLDKIKKAVSMSGYDANEVPANPKAYKNLHECCKKDAEH